jgi:hypothetical protein
VTATYARQAATALRLISKSGADVVFTRKGVGTFDPVTQAETGAVDKTITMKAVGIAPGKSAEFKIGSLVGRNLMELHCAPNLGDTPLPGDTALWSKRSWKVVYVDALDPAADGSPYCRVYLEI